MFSDILVMAFVTMGVVSIIPAILVFREYLIFINKINDREGRRLSHRKESEIRINKRVLQIFILFLAAVTGMVVSYAGIFGKAYGAALSGYTGGGVRAVNETIFFVLSVILYIISFFKGNSMLSDFDQDDLLIGKSMINFIKFFTYFILSIVIIGVLLGS